MARGRGTARQAQSGAQSTAATAALTRAAVPFVLHHYDHDERAVAAAGSYGQEAAAALGVPAERVFKTLVTEVDTAGRGGGPGLVVAVVPVARRLDLKALAVVLGGKRAVMADPAAAERATGYVVGGISPVGQRRPLPTVLDVSATAWETVFVSAGRRGADIEVAAADLVRVTRASVAAISH